MNSLQAERTTPTRRFVERSRAEAPPRSFRRTLATLLGAIVITSLVSHGVARWVELRKPIPTFRRIGPVEGPQAICAGSSVLQFAISWRAVSELLNQGIESWGLGGSTPLEWDVFDGWTKNSNLMIAGVSMYDLNEGHSCNWSANIVPLSQMIADLRESGMSWDHSKYVLSQYPLAYTRKLFPTAGNSDAVLVGLRRKLVGFRQTAFAGDLVAADQPKADPGDAVAPPPDYTVLELGGTMERMSDWPEAKLRRRLAHFTRSHSYKGPIRLAFRRMLTRAQQRGRVVVVVLPVSPSYERELTTAEARQAFEGTLQELQRDFPAASFVRLDHVQQLKNDELFEDPVHLNGAGKQVATEAFLNALRAQ